MVETNKQQFAELLQDFDTAMLITQSSHGALHARPMAIAKHGEGGVVYFATSWASAKIGEVETRPEVVVTMQDANCYLSLSGRAEIMDDRALIKRFYSPAWKIWFPEGRDDSDLVLLKIEPVRGACWDMNKTTNKMRFAFEAGKAYLENE